MKALSFQIPDDLKQELKRESNARQCSISEIVRLKLMDAPVFIPEVKKYIEVAQNASGVTFGKTIQSLLTVFVAEKIADLDVWGDDPNQFEFFGREDGILATDKNLFDRVHSEKVRENEEIRERQLLEMESAGKKLRDEDVYFLIKRRKGKAWLSSQEFQKEVSEHIQTSNIASEARQSGLVPDNLRISDFTLASLWVEVRENRISRDEFAEQLSVFGRAERVHGSAAERVSEARRKAESSNE